MTDRPVRLASDLDERVRMAQAIRSAGHSFKSGRASSFVDTPGFVPNSPAGQITRLFDQYAPLAYQLPWQILDYVEILATYNPDYSQAVENIKMLANSGHVLQVQAQSDLAARRAKEYLEEKARTIQEPHGGIDGIIDKLLDQAATFGAMCGEWILSEDLTEVVDFVDLSPKRIRFFWLKDEDRWAPFQKVSGLQLQEAKNRGQETRGNCVRLNELTFRYYAFDAAPESPYGTPPFLAALANIAIQRDMVYNMAQIVQKIGLLGIIDLKIERLQPLQGESDEAYAMRAADYLSAYAEIAEATAREGGLSHFDDVELNTTQIGGNAAGATNIHKANEEMVFSGLKSMPSVQGRSYSTTETYAGVAYDIIIRNTAKYQRAAKRMIESGYWLMLTLANLPADSVTLSFNENRSLNRLQEAQAQKFEIANAFMKWLLGIINQIDVAHELGYSEPATALDAPPPELIGIASAHMVDALQDSDFDNQPPATGTIGEETDERSDPDDERERQELEEG